MDFWPILEMRLDYWSVLDRLSEIESYPWDGVKNEYYDDYADLFNEMAGLSAEFYNEFERLIRDLEYTWSLPKRKLENTGMENARGAAWFDMAVSLLNETDMSVLLENEGVYDPDDIDRERQKRRKAVLALTKEQQFSLFTQVFHVIHQTAFTGKMAPVPKGHPSPFRNTAVWTMKNVLYFHRRP